MPRPGRIPFLILVSVCIWRSQAIEAPATSYTGAVAGIVAESTKGAPMGGAGVYLTPSHRIPFTEISGAYYMANLPSGDYSLLNSASGYQDRSSATTVGTGDVRGRNVVLAAATKQIEIPNVLGQQLEEAEATLAASGLTVGNVTWIFSTLPVGEVISQNPVPSNLDTDGDGLTDENEIGVFGTDPFESDTDGDGVSDGVEIALGTDPLVAPITAPIAIPNAPIYSWLVFLALLLAASLVKKLREP